MIHPPLEQGAAMAEAPGIVHGFFGRRCGNGSPGRPFNMSERFGTPDEVAGNRRMALTALGVPTVPLAGVRQIHSNRVVRITSAPDMQQRTEADGLVAAVPEIAIGVLTADCGPILFADADAGVIGACHAGWQGAVDGILENTLAEMVDLGAAAERIIATLGPTISGRNYEIGPEFAAALAERNARALPHVFTPRGKTREHFDLPGFILSELNRLGVGQAEHVGDCTYAKPTRYFSHRYDTHHERPSGRQIAVIVRR